MTPLKSTLLVLALFLTSLSNLFSQTCDYIYVSTSGSNANPGTESSPVQTLAYAMTLVSGTRTFIRMEAGTYNESSIINLQNNVQIDGRFTVSAGVWTKSSSATTTINFSGEETVAGVTHRVGIKANGISGWGLTDLIITTTNATGVDPSGRGKSNYAVWLNNCSNYTISRCSITSGNASAGANGVNGTAGSNGNNGAVGQNGSCDGGTCTFSSGFAGSAGGNGGNGGGGGAGGAGGAAVTGAQNNGSAGTAGTGRNGGGGGGGGAGGDECSTNNAGNGGDGAASACAVGTAGANRGGQGNPGNPGSAGVNGNSGTTGTTGAVGTSNSFSSGFVIPGGQGGTGTDGCGGSGGAGGGGGGRQTCTLCDNGNGNGAGGGGGGGQGGTGGTGGKGGGSTFAIMSTLSTSGASISQTTLINGTPGNGGTGGAGGAGGAGGNGGVGASSCTVEVGRGGNGGNGGSGGAGGNGGAGVIGLSGQLCSDGTISSPSVVITSTPVITANYYGCTNSEVALTTASGVWAIQPTASLINNLTSSTSSYTTSSASAIMTYSSTGYKDINNGTAFNNFVSIIKTRALPTFDAGMAATACEGATYTLNTPTTGVQYEWVVFLASSTTASPLVILTTQSANWTIPTVGSSTNYSVRLRVKDACCGWSAPVYFNFSGSPLSTAPTIASIPGTVCPNVNTTLTASGGVAGSGSTINWYTGPNGTGNLLGTGASIIVAPSSTTTYYARREGTCNTTSDASVVVNVKTYIYAANGTTSSNYCTDNAGWNHFYVGNDIILSVQGDLSGAGVVTATIYDNGSYYQNTTNPALCSSNANPGEQSFEMARSWNLDLNGGTPIGTYNVRFYHTAAEKTAIENAAITWMATYPACSYSYKYATPLGFYWFKNTGSNYTAADYDGLHLTGTSGTTSNGINYAELTGVTSFSGGSGAVTLIPLDVLPVTLSSFNAICSDDKKSARIDWTTTTEQNSSYFVVERSTDAVNWNAVATVEAAGNSVSTLNYSYTDNDIRQYDLVYYRLKEYDQDAAMMQSGIVSLNCVETTSGFDLYPNPTNAELNVLIYGVDKSKPITFMITDLKGQQVKSIEGSLETENLMQLDVNSLAPGCYIIQMIQQNANIKSMRFIKE